MKKRVICVLAVALLLSACVDSGEKAAEENPSIPKISLSADTIMLYPYAENNLDVKREDGETGYWLYDFSDKLTVGLSNDGDILRYTQMYFGFSASVNDETVSYSLYNNTENVVEADAFLVSDSDKTEISMSDKENTIDTSRLDNGLYLIEASINGYDAKMGIYVNGESTYLCTLSLESDEQMQEYSDRKERIAELLYEYEITPENSADTEELCYPWYAYDDEHRDDTQAWESIAESLVKAYWSDERKVLAFHDYLTENMAFDYYRTEKLGKSRAMTYGIYSGKYSMLDDHIGVCFDFQNVLSIMCRSQGIPAVSIDTDTHTWNLVYLGGRWLEIDMAQDIKRAVYGEDVTEVENADETVCYDGFCTVNVNNRSYKELEGINICLWTTAKAKGEEITPYTRTS